MVFGSYRICRTSLTWEHDNRKRFLPLFFWVRAISFSISEIFSRIPILVYTISFSQGNNGKTKQEYQMWQQTKNYLNSMAEKQCCHFLKRGSIKMNWSDLKFSKMIHLLNWSIDLSCHSSVGSLTHLNLEAFIWGIGILISLLSQR